METSFKTRLPVAFYVFLGIAIVATLANVLYGLIVFTGLGFGSGFGPLSAPDFLLWLLPVLTVLAMSAYFFARSVAICLAWALFVVHFAINFRLEFGKSMGGNWIAQYASTAFGALIQSVCIPGIFAVAVCLTSAGLIQMAYSGQHQLPCAEA